MSPRNRVTAAMLAFFTGIVGGHKLYLEQTGGFIGFMILLMVSLSVGIPITLIAGVMQGVKLLQMSDQEFDKRYNRGIAVVRKGPLDVRREEQLRRYEQDNGSQGRAQTSPLRQQRANPYKASGIKKYKDFDLEDAIGDFQKGLEISPNDVALHFNLACAYSLTEKKALAYHHLGKAVSLGLKDVERILRHDDLAYVRIQPEWDDFRAGGFRVNPFERQVKESQPSAPKTAAYTQDKTELDDSLLAQLNKLSELRKKGILSEEEFVAERKKVLNQ